MSAEDDGGVKWPMDPDKTGVMLKVGDWVVDPDLSPDPRIITSISSRGALSTRSADGSITGSTWPKYVSRVHESGKPLNNVSASLPICPFSPHVLALDRGCDQSTEREGKCGYAT